MVFMDIWWKFSDWGSIRLKASSYPGQHKHRKNAYIYLSVIRAHSPSVPAEEIVYTLNRATTVMGKFVKYKFKFRTVAILVIVDE
jgi:hypothetical protein